MNRVAIAYHEAGHVVIALELGVAVKRATIKPGDKVHGQVDHSALLTRRDIRVVGHHRDTPHQRDKFEKLAIICLAGPMAQRRYAPKSWRHWHGASDYCLFGAVARNLGGNGRALKQYTELLMVWTDTCVDRRWLEIEHVAAALLERETLGEQDIKSIALG